jgi:TonB-dependent receptor
MAGAKFATKSENDSLGFNVEWDVSDSLGLEFDVHSSSAETGADSPYGSNATLGTAGFFRGTTTVDFTRDFPVLSVELPPGMSSIDPSRMLVTGSSFRNSYMKSDVDQGQIRGHFDFAEASRLDFGVSLTNVKNRTAFSNVQRDTWGGATSPDDYPDSVWHLQSVRPYFDNISGSGNSALFNQFFTFDFETVRQLAATAAGDESLYLASDVFTTDRRVEEKSKSAYLQYSTTFDTTMPVNLNAGVRFEKTEVTSTALVPTATGIVWVANNEFSVQFSDPGYTTLKGDYQYTLPSLDLSIETTADTILRFSYGESIGRPGWGDIQGGQTLNQLARINGGSGAQGNPGLKPLESQNFDVSFEWYYGESSYVSLGYFRKNIDNYIGVTTISATPFDLNTPAGGVYFSEAVANGCSTADLTCIRNYIFDNHDGDPGVVRGADDANGNRTGTIAGQPGDPVANFLITTPANQKSASLDGWEFNIQHMFGDSGFGVSANYTMVDSGLDYDNYDRGEQFALEGVSDSANLVGFYEKYDWSVRLAYNWRDEFLAGRFDGTGLPNPVYTEAYGQWDMNVGYQWSDQLSFQAEVINLTDEIQRLHGRTTNEVLYVTQTGPRYMVGLRYKF